VESTLPSEFQTNFVMRKPLIDQSGEVRELTGEDFKQFRPATEVLPVSLQEKIGMRERADSHGDATTKMRKAWPHKDEG